MMGITSISLVPEPHHGDGVGVQIGGGGATRWAFTDEAPSAEAPRVHVALATPCDTTTPLVSSEEVNIWEDKLFVQLGEKTGEGRTR